MVCKIKLSVNNAYRMTFDLVSCSAAQGRRNESRAKGGGQCRRQGQLWSYEGGNADGKGNFGLMNYIYKVVNVNPQISKPRNSSYNAEIKNLYAVVTISLQIVDNKWFTMLRWYGSVHIYTFIKYTL